MNKTALLSLLCLLLATQNVPLGAQETNLLSFAVGHYGLLNNDDDALDLRLEYRPAQSILIENLQPWHGVELTSDGSAWGGGGLLYDWEFLPSWHATPSLGAGLYLQGGSEKDLGHPLVFRSQLELAYEFKKTSRRLGTALSHFSNGGLGQHNAGTEVLNLYYHIPY